MDVITQKELEEAEMAEDFTHPRLYALLTRVMNGAIVQMDGTAYDRTIRIPIRLGDKIIVRATAMNAPHHQQMAEEFREAAKALRTLTRDNSLSTAARRSAVDNYHVAVDRILLLAREAVTDSLYRFNNERDFSRMSHLLAGHLCLESGRVRLVSTAYCLRFGWISISMWILGSVEKSFLRLTCPTLP